MTPVRRHPSARLSAVRVVQSSAARIGIIFGGLAFGLSSLATSAWGATDDYQYLSPLPGSSIVSPWNNVVVREGRVLDPASLTDDAVAVAGAASGDHSGTLALSDDGRTLVFTPAVPFALGEVVTVTLEGDLRTASGLPLAPFAFTFTIALADPLRQFGAWPEEVAEGPPPSGLDATTPSGVEAPSLDLEPSALEAFPCLPFPAAYPQITVIRSHNPEPGYVFMTPFTTSPPGHLLIVDNLGYPVFYRQTAQSSHDLRIQPNGLLTYFDRRPPGGGPAAYFALDSAYSVVDSFATGNGYITDSHELVLLPNGHALLMSYDPQPLRMDLVVSGGDPTAIVTGFVLQELDLAKRVVFQWRSWDHFAITDVASPAQNLRGHRVDYVHGNAVDVDLDGNLLLSSRHLSEITKIDHATGAILWRWGLNAHQNDFTFLNDPRGFSHQHDVRRLPNGHLTLFDNGNYLVPQFSRGLEYALDEQAMTATLVWSYATTPATYAPFLGSVQRRANGSTMIAFGGAATLLRVVDLDANNGETLALGLAPQVWTYRAHRFPWRTTLFTTDVEALDFAEVGVGSAATRSIVVRNPSTAALEIVCAPTTNPVFEVEDDLPLVVPAGGEAAIHVTFRPGFATFYDAKVYLRKMTDREIVAQDVALSGRGVINRPPDVSGARASLETLWPPDHGLVPVTIDDVIDPDGDPVVIAITGVTQDESANDRGDGATCPDAEIDGPVARLRAERSALGNGRVIRVAFEARDSRSGVAPGAVTVCVPHDSSGPVAEIDAREGGEVRQRTEGALAGCLDDGQAYDALGACASPRQRGRAATEPETVAGPTLTAVSGSGASATATVKYVLVRDAEVMLGVYDLSGRRVATLDRGARPAGTHRVTWDTTALSPGVYFYRLSAAGVALTRPLVVRR